MVAAVASAAVTVTDDGDVDGGWAGMVDAPAGDAVCVCTCVSMLLRICPTKLPMVVWVRLSGVTCDICAICVICDTAASNICCSDASWTAGSDAIVNADEDEDEDEEDVNGDGGGEVVFGARIGPMRAPTLDSKCWKNAAEPAAEPAAETEFAAPSFAAAEFIWVGVAAPDFWLFSDIRLYRPKMI